MLRAKRHLAQTARYDLLLALADFCGNIYPLEFLGALRLKDEFYNLVSFHNDLHEGSRSYLVSSDTACFVVQSACAIKRKLMSAAR